MSVVHRRGPADVQASMTPMIDVTFLLIVFFVLVSQIVEVENVDMDLPAPEDPATELAGDEQRAVVNVIPGGDGDAAGYRVGGRTFGPGPEGIAGLVDHLAGLYRASPGLRINLRADRRTRFAAVEPVMQAVSTAATRAAGPGDGRPAARLNLVVVRED
ncbi:MAG: ExbD/TolR family protein [Planctomycetota bacterium]|jgi:biopolymer transport protein ExbD